MNRAETKGPHLTPERDFRALQKKPTLNPFKVVAQKWESLIDILRPTNLTELALVTRQFATLMKAGIGIVRSLEVVCDQGIPGRIPAAWTDLAVQVSRGVSLSRGMARHPRVFDGLYRGLIKSGESTGSLVDSLETLSALLEKEVKLRQKIASALTYPALVLLICLAATFYLTQHVLPSIINSLFREAGLNLPLITRFVIGVTDFVNDRRFWLFGVPGLIVTIFLILSYLRTAGGQYRFQFLCLATPVVGELNRKLICTRFARTMSCLLRAGIPLIHCLQLSDMVVANYVLSPQIQNIIDDVKEGEPLSEAIRKVSFFPPLLSSFTELGEQAGQMPLLYIKLSDMLDEELGNAIDSATTLLEPLLIGVLGSVVGVIVLAIFLPLYQVLAAI